MIDSIKKKDCTGCKMCKDVCPVNAINFKSDEEGFWYPVVDYTKCIKCEKCKKFCPSYTKIKANIDKPKVYAAYLLNDEIRLKSTSGGIYYAFASYILQKGGYIVGCRYSEDYKSAYHIISEKVEDLEKIIGSKYFQSDTEGIYKQISEILKKGKQVLFCGTPCQAAALMKFLGQSYENLYIIDFICRGINSPKIFKAFLEDLETQYKGKVIKVHLKNKDTGWTSLATKVEFDNGKIYYADKQKDLWVQGYIYGNLFMRTCCFECKYKNIPRISDISLGDFWGDIELTEEDEFKGVSIVLVNSQKGEKLMQEVSGTIFKEIHSLDEAINGNPCLVESAEKGDRRNLFFRKIKTNTFSETITICMQTSIYLRIKRKLKNIYFWLQRRIKKC